VKPYSILVCCVVLGAALTACKGETSSPAEGDPKAGAPAEGDSQGVARPGQPVKLVRDVKKTAVEVDTSAPANVGAAPEDAKRSKSGLAWIVLKEGTGEVRPAAGDSALMNFIGWTADGKLVQESLSAGRPASMGISNMFTGLAEGVQSMVKGEKRRFWIPGKLAFGEAKPGEPLADEGPPLGMLVYDVELLDFAAPGPSPAVPPLAEPPTGEE
jgi:FKBP-type peptidyl-prolyl cis-trans isomerase